ncbi:MAG: hypothetical protein AAF806_23115 [Bacteroidota bacterium]
MRQSRLVKRLENLDSRQKEQFSKFVNSPYFNQHDKTSKLLDLIYIALEKQKSSNLEREKIFQKLYPKEKYEEQRLHNVMSYLMRLYHRFLAVQRFEEQEFEESVSTLEQAFNGNELEVFTNRSKLFEKTIKDHSTPDKYYHHALFRYHTLRREYRVNNVKRSDEESGHQWSKALDDYYILEKLQQSCILRAHEMIMNTSYDFTLSDVIVNYVAENWDSYQNNPTIAAYYTVLRMLNDSNNDGHYQYLKDLLLKNSSKYSYYDLNELYNFASNYCILKINTGNVDFQKELFDIYKQTVKTETVLRNGKMTGWDYKNISTLGCHLGEFNWTYHFIESHKDKLLQSHQNNAYNYSLAYYYFTKKDYDKASSLLLQVQFTEMQYHMGGNLLLMRSYYELENLDALFSLLESMRIYAIRSKKMTTKEKRGYKNLLRFAKRLVAIKSEKIALTQKDFLKKINKLQEEINGTENIYAKSWLVAKCNDLAA